MGGVGAATAFTLLLRELGEIAAALAREDPTPHLGHQGRVLREAGSFVRFKDSSTKRTSSASKTWGPQAIAQASSWRPQGGTHDAAAPELLHQGANPILGPVGKRRRRRLVMQEALAVEGLIAGVESLKQFFSRRNANLERVQRRVEPPPRPHTQAFRTDNQCLSRRRPTAAMLGAPGAPGARQLHRPRGRLWAFTNNAA